MKKVKVTYYRNRKFLWWKYQTIHSVKIFDTIEWKVYEKQVLKHFRDRVKVEYFE